ncbi:uncharacterized protein LOC116940693 isoform X3 [Petromyzon marinus]|uniref:uncharacterized protein LOC116940693 isoform X3 n=1 Tax=Petromyzon marinus TaxID=7757 RepID=UPI003F713FC6
MESHVTELCVPSPERARSRSEESCGVVLRTGACGHPRKELSGQCAVPNHEGLVQHPHSSPGSVLPPPLPPFQHPPPPRAAVAMLLRAMCGFGSGLERGGGPPAPLGSPRPKPRPRELHRSRQLHVRALPPRVILQRQCAHVRVLLHGGLPVPHELPPVQPGVSPARGGPGAVSPVHAGLLLTGAGSAALLGVRPRELRIAARGLELPPVSQRKLHAGIELIHVSPLRTRVVQLGARLVRVPAVRDGIQLQSPEKAPLPCPVGAFCPAGSQEPSLCVPPFLRWGGDHCSPSPLLIGLVAGSTLALLLLLFLALNHCNQRLRDEPGARTPLLWHSRQRRGDRVQDQEPMYTGW